MKIRKQYLKIQKTGKDRIATDLTVIPCGMHTRLDVIHEALQKGKSNAERPQLLEVFDSEKPLVRGISPSGDGEADVSVHRKTEVTMPAAIPE